MREKTNFTKMYFFGVFIVHRSSLRTCLVNRILYKKLLGLKEFARQMDRQRTESRLFLLNKLKRLITVLPVNLQGSREMSQVELSQEWKSLLASLTSSS